jgi:hypothetical protein
MAVRTKVGPTKVVLRGTLEIVPPKRKKGKLKKKGSELKEKT